MGRGDFMEMDKIIREQHLTRALQSQPHLRSNHELDLVSSFVVNSWAKAQELGHKRVMMLARCVSWFQVNEGELILEEGKGSRTFYIIVNGQVDIIKAAAKTEKMTKEGGVVATLGAGTSFGEIALESGLTTATVKALTETVDLLVLYKSDYDQIMNEYVRG